MGWVDRAHGGGGQRSERVRWGLGWVAGGGWPASDGSAGSHDESRPAQTGGEQCESELHTRVHQPDQAEGGRESGQGGEGREGGDGGDGGGEGLEW